MAVAPDRGCELTAMGSPSSASVGILFATMVPLRPPSISRPAAPRRREGGTPTGCGGAPSENFQDLMAALQPPPRLTCFEYRGRVPGGLTRPLRFVARDVEGRERQVILKLRVPDGPRHSHFGPTSLACELVSAMLARGIGLNVPDYFIAELPQSVPAGVFDSALRSLLLRNVGLNFGSGYVTGADTWRHTRQVLPSDLAGALEETLIFDATILNGDRKAAKPNLLWSGDARLLLIDHSLALAHGLPPTTLLSETDVRDHCSYAPLFGKGRLFNALLARWRSAVSEATIESIRSAIPESWESKPGDIDAILSLLQGRPPVFDEIESDLRRIVK